jgi:hypothetical protein
LYNAIRKYSWEDWDWEIVYRGTLDYDIQEKERELIAKFDSTHRDKGYNVAPGGDGGTGHRLTDDHKKKLSDANSADRNA